MLARALLAAVAALLLRAGAAPAQLPFEPPKGRACVRVARYVPPPAVSQLADSAALLAELDSLIAGRKTAPGHFVAFSLRFLADGSLRDVKVVTESLGDQRAALQAMVRRHVRPQPPRPKPFSWGMTLEKDPASNLVLEVQQALACPPQLENRDLLAARLTWELDAFQRMGGHLPPTGRVVLVKLRIRPDGVPTSLAVTRTSGDPALDDAALRMVALARFLPGLAYLGSPQLVPVPVLVQMPVTFKPGPGPAVR